MTSCAITKMRCRMTSLAYPSSAFSKVLARSESGRRRQSHCPRARDFISLLHRRHTRLPYFAILFPTNPDRANASKDEEASMTIPNPNGPFRLLAPCPRITYASSRRGQIRGQRSQPANGAHSVSNFALTVLVSIRAEGRGVHGDHF